MTRMLKATLEVKRSPRREDASGGNETVGPSDGLLVSGQPFLPRICES